jgi:hypothetical protein
MESNNTENGKLFIDFSDGIKLFVVSCHKTHEDEINLINGFLSVYEFFIYNL